MNFWKQYIFWKTYISQWRSFSYGYISKSMTLNFRDYEAFLTFRFNKLFRKILACSKRKNYKFYYIDSFYTRHKGVELLEESIERSLFNVIFNLEICRTIRNCLKQWIFEIFFFVIIVSNFYSWHRMVGKSLYICSFLIFSFLKKFPLFQKKNLYLFFIVSSYIRHNYEWLLEECTVKILLEIILNNEMCTTIENFWKQCIFKKPLFHITYSFFIGIFSDAWLKNFQYLRLFLHLFFKIILKKLLIFVKEKFAHIIALIVLIPEKYTNHCWKNVL